MKRLCVDRLFVLVGLVAGPTTAAEPLAAPAAVRTHFDRVERLDLSAPGALVAHAAPRGVDGGRTLVLLIRPPTESASTPDEPTTTERSPCEPPIAPRLPLELWTAALPAPDAEPLPPIRVRADLPHNASGLVARDINRDGIDELLVFTPKALLVYGEIDGHTAVTGPTVAVDLEALGAESASGAGFRLADDGAIAAVAIPGAIHFYVPGLESRWRLDREFPVEPTASVHGGRISVWTPGVDWLGRDREGLTVWAAYLGQPDARRLRVLLLRPDAQDPARRAQDCWVRFPEPESPIEVEAQLFDGDPLLVVASRAADKLSLLGEKRLRVFPLAPDRSRLGRPPLIAVDSRMNLWQDAYFFARDVERQGRSDLVVGYWKGLLDSRIVLDRYPRLPDGTFRSPPETTAFNVDGGREESVALGSFLSSGGGDLILFDNESMLVYPASSPESAKKGLVDRNSVLRVPLPGGANLEGGATMVLALGDESSLRRLVRTPRSTGFVDIDGDGRSELLVPGGTSPATVHLIRFDPH